MRNLVQELLAKGYSKYRIAKEVKVSWNTVRRWELGTLTPREDNGLKLLELLNGGEK